MTVPTSSGPAAGGVRLYGEEFAARPEAAYDKLRAEGPVAWAELAPGVRALVVVSRRAARDLLNEEETYSKDSRLWGDLARGAVPRDSPVLALMAFRPSLLYADRDRHARLRHAMDDCLARINLHHLRDRTRGHAAVLIERFARDGHADLMSQYADLLPLLVFADLMGCPAAMVERMVTACQGMIDAGPRAEQAAADLAAVLAEIIQLKSGRPGDDCTTWMLAHPARLGHEEILHQLVVLIGAGTIPTAAWIAATLRLLLTDATYAGDLSGGAVTVRRAMEQALWTHSPMANFAVHYARYDTALHGVPIPAGVPVLVSHAATGTDPSVPHPGYGNRSHLAWSAGPHRCPAVSHASIIAQTGIETLLDRLWDLDLIDPFAPNRPGPFHQCPASLGIRFRPHTADTPTAPSLPNAGGLRDHGTNPPRHHRHPPV
ncbi:cytochrome P450 [Actinomadura sp. ATCC 31491]|uniref:Cytochrome P450 n=1 Tax=Actinomadura luzonensis TaxID=2805427 RepID=A0ABT0FWG8_9ACTN|nr:cytochrome P450 [Actinomadura luzonensis]MCK2216285.1 cytochrome P450 [Actinomadura luzonensis]